jgi:hypothetical protein
MTYRPEFRNGEFDIVPMDYMSRDEVAALGVQLHEAVAEPDTQDLLLERHLDGVVARHERYADSMHTVQRAREQHVTTSNQNYGVLVGGERWIGMGSLMPGLPLRAPQAQPLGLLPAGVTRGNHMLSRPVPVEGPNITAWVAEQYSDSHLTEVYRTLGEIAGHGWTIEPIRSRQGTRALRAAGFVAASGQLRYDDMETRHRPPVSQLFTYS